MTKDRTLRRLFGLLPTLLLVGAALAQDGDSAPLAAADLKREGGVLHYAGVWDWQHQNTSSFELDPEKDKFLYIYNGARHTLPYTLKDSAAGNAILEFVLPDGNHAQFEWAGRDVVKGRFWLKDVAKSGNPVTRTTMKRDGAAKGEAEHGWDYGDERDWPYKGDPNVQSPIEVPRRGGENRLPARYEELEVKSVVHNGHAFQLNYADVGGVIETEERGFRLVQFHFHSPSEHRQTGYAGWTDEKGKKYPGHYAMEVHFVHQATDEDPEAPGWRRDLAVVGVFIKEGRPNPDLAKIWAVCPKTQHENRTPALKSFDASKLMPRGGNYQTYRGSLTTPPLSSGVSWFVMDEPIEASREQIEEFRKAMKRNTNRSIQGRLDSRLQRK